MPPKVKVTKEDIVRAAVDIVRAQGESGLNARDIAVALNCSTQPIFSNFASMEQLRQSVIAEADRLCDDCMLRETQSGQYPPYKASGMAYIRFAREEPELFKLLYMRDRSLERIPETTEATERMFSMVQNNTGFDSREAEFFHLEMWAFVHGIAAMTATGFLQLDMELISRMLTDAYQGLKLRHEREQDNGSHQD